MTRRLEGKVAIITGAGSVGPGWGNGRATAVRFAEEGAKIFAVDRDAERLRETVDAVKRAGARSRPSSVRRHARGGRRRDGRRLREDLRPNRHPW
jgi:NAD(P)-dependent dehydrogenase (short-subunit alcohol dehydrogenase family)